MFLQEYLLYGHQAIEGVVCERDAIINLTTDPKFFSGFRELLNEYMCGAHAWNNIVGCLPPQDSKLQNATKHILGMYDALQGCLEKKDTASLLEHLWQMPFFSAAPLSDIWEGVKAQRVLAKGEDFVVDLPGEERMWDFFSPRRALAAHFTDEEVFIKHAVGKALSNPSVPPEVACTLNGIYWMYFNEIELPLGGQKSIDIAMANHEPRLPERLLQSYMDGFTASKPKSTTLKTLSLD